MNLQNIPSKSKNIRLMFKAGKRNDKVCVDSSEVTLHITDEVETDRGFVAVSLIKVGDNLSDGTNIAPVRELQKIDSQHVHIFLGTVINNL